MPTPRTKTRKAAAKPGSTISHAASAPDALTASVTFLVGAAIAAFLFLANPYLAPFEAYHLVNDALLLGLPIIVIILFLHQEPSHFGLTSGDKALGLRLTAVALIPILVIAFFAARQPSFQHYYGQTLEQPLAMVWYVFGLDRRPHLNITGLVYYEALMGFYFFCWEFFFRGFLLFGLAKAKFLGDYGAVIAQAIPFTLLHWSLVSAASKPPIEIASALVGGIVLGIIAVRTRTFFYGFLMHWMLSLTLDLCIIGPSLLHPHA